MRLKTGHDGGLTSRERGLRLRSEEGEVRFDRLDTGEPLLTPAEARRAAEAELARLREELRRRPRGRVFSGSATCLCRPQPSRAVASDRDRHPAHRTRRAAFHSSFCPWLATPRACSIVKEPSYRQDNTIGAQSDGKYDAALILVIIHNYGLLSRGGRRLFFRQGPPRAWQLRGKSFPCKSLQQGASNRNSR